MRVNQRVEDGVDVVELTGRIDLHSASTLRSLLRVGSNIAVQL